jgi:hypothetical protein
MRVALLKGRSMYGVLRAFIDEVAEGFSARGWEAIVIDFENATADDIVPRLAECGHLDLIYSINAFASYADSMGRSITDLTGAPHVLQYVDFPLQWLERFQALPRSIALLLVDRSHVRAIETLCGKDRFAHLGFCAHGGLGKPVLLPQDAGAWAESRPIEMLFAASNYRPEADVWAPLPDLIRGVFIKAVDQALSVEWITPLDALDDALAEAGLDPRNPDLPAELQSELLNIRVLCSMVHEQVRKERRQRFVSAAQKAKLPLTVAGNGWDGVTGLTANKGPVSIEETEALMRQSRLCINVSVNFGEGSHERPLSAMLAGAAVASDTTSFYREAFVPGQEIALFRWMSLDEDLARLAEFARDPQALFAMAQAGQAAAVKSHRWDSRIDTYIEAGRAVARKLSLKSALAE